MSARPRAAMSAPGPPGRGPQWQPACPASGSAGRQGAPGWPRSGVQPSVVLGHRLVWLGWPATHTLPGAVPVPAAIPCTAAVLWTAALIPGCAPQKRRELARDLAQARAAHLEETVEKGHDALMDSAAAAAQALHLPSEQLQQERRERAGRRARRQQQRRRCGPRPPLSPLASADWPTAGCSLLWTHLSIPCPLRLSTCCRAQGAANNA